MTTEIATDFTTSSWPRILLRKHSHEFYYGNIILLRKHSHGFYNGSLTTDFATELLLRILLRKLDHGNCYKIIATEFATKHATEVATEKEPWNSLRTNGYGNRYGVHLWNSLRNTWATESVRSKLATEIKVRSKPIRYGVYCNGTVP